MDGKIRIYVGNAGKEKIGIDAQEIVTGRTCVIAQSGAGKSWTIAVLCEQLLKNNIGFCIIDTEGEYFSLKQKFQIMWVGGENADINIETANLGELCKKAVKENVPMIFDVSDVSDERKKVAELASTFYSIATDLRVPYLLIVEESDKFIPQNRDSLKELEEISKRGRKRGLGLLIATQRPSLVNKNVLSQCGNQFIGKLTTENDLKAVDLFFPNRKELEELPKLNAGEFFVFGNILRGKKQVMIAARETQHKGLTPKLIPKPIGKIEELIADVSRIPAPKEFAEGELPEEKKGEGYLPKTAGPNALAPAVSKEKVLELAEKSKKKKFVLFGAKESLRTVNLVYYPLAYVEIKMLEGLIMKNFNVYSFIADGTNGKLVEIKDGLRFSDGFVPGLDEKEAKVLSEIAKAKKASIAELELRAKLSDGTLRAITKRLADRGLVTCTEEKRTKFYSPLHKVRLPDVKRKSMLPALEAKATGQANLRKEDIRSMLKATHPSSDVTHFEIFYYPLWKVRLENREIFFDGMTGKSLLFD